MSKLSRRDFLRTSAALLAGAALARTAPLASLARAGAAGRPNVLILVFDAMSARHLSLYGYGRETTPNLSRFAGRATVYHRHYSAGNFTTSGTASLLTGLYPWTHRAINLRGMIARSLVDRNLFRLVGRDYTRIAFTQNLWADLLLSQFEADLDLHLPCDSFSRAVHSLIQPDDLPSDRRLAYYVFQDFFNLRVVEPHPYPGSLLLGAADFARALGTEWDGTTDRYPRGLPGNYDYSYEHPAVFAGIAQLIQEQLTQSQPCLAYFHLWSPHDPYNARREFIGLFAEEQDLPRKPRHPLASGSHSEAVLRARRREYDEFIADLDAEFGRLMSVLERAGVLENSYVIVTSDHGELFERGELGHASALLYAPVTHVPLLISAPGQQARTDVRAPTCSVDLLPTVLRITGQEIPAWVEGRPLPGPGGADDTARGLFAMVAKDNAAFRPITQATFALIRGGRELLYSTGYKGQADAFELYDLDDDPDELRNLFTEDITTASRMKEELLEAIDAANREIQSPTK